MTQYSKFWVALGGLALLIAMPIISQKLGINFDQQTQLVVNLVVSALTAAGVYQVKNGDDQ